MPENAPDTPADPNAPTPETLVEFREFCQAELEVHRQFTRSKIRLVLEVIVGGVGPIAVYDYCMRQITGTNSVSEWPGGWPAALVLLVIGGALSRLRTNTYARRWQSYFRRNHDERAHMADFAERYQKQARVVVEGMGWNWESFLTSLEDKIARSL